MVLEFGDDDPYDRKKNLGNILACTLPQDCIKWGWGDIVDILCFLKQVIIKLIE